MPKLKPDQLPRYRLHKPTGRAVVTLNGRDVYLGKHGSAASRAMYARVTGEWLTRGRLLPVLPEDKRPLTVLELVVAFRRHAAMYYRKPDGKPTGELNTYIQALKILRKFYGRTEASEFGPLCLKAVRDVMVAKGWCRAYVNRQVSRVKSVFRWGVENEIVPPSVHHGLAAVQGLKAGRTEARERPRIQPVPEAIVEATLPHVSPTVRTMIEVQLLTGMRPGEVCAMRAIDIDTTGKLWRYVPKEHKTEHFGHDRVVYLGPQAQQLVAPFLKPDVNTYLFDPREAEADRREQLHAARSTPHSCGNVPGSNRRRRPVREPGECYDTASYRRAIARGCDRAFPPPEHLRPRVWTEGGRERRESVGAFKARLTPEQRKELAAWQKQHRWHPHQLRHTAATKLRKTYGLEAAQVILGHRTLTVTQLYAEKNVAAAQRIMGEVG